MKSSSLYLSLRKGPAARDIETIVSRASNMETNALWLFILEECTAFGHAIIARGHSFSSSLDTGPILNEEGHTFVCLDGFIGSLCRDIKNGDTDHGKENALLVYHYIISLNASILESEGTFDADVRDVIEKNLVYRSAISSSTIYLYERALAAMSSIDRNAQSLQLTSSSTSTSIESKLMKDLKSYFLALRWQNVPGIFVESKLDHLKVILNALHFYKDSATDVKLLPENISDIELLLGALYTLAKCALSELHGVSISDTFFHDFCDYSSVWAPLAISCVKYRLKELFQAKQVYPSHEASINMIMTLLRRLQWIRRLKDPLDSLEERALKWLSLCEGPGSIIALVDQVGEVYSALSNDVTDALVLTLHGHWLACLLGFPSGSSMTQYLYFSKMPKRVAKDKLLFACLAKLYTPHTMEAYVECVNVIAAAVSGQFRAEGSFEEFIATSEGKHAINSILRCLRPLVLPSPVISNQNDQNSDIPQVALVHRRAGDILTKLCAASWPAVDELLGINMDSSNYKYNGEDQGPTKFGDFLDISLGLGLSESTTRASMCGHLRTLVAAHAVCAIYKGGQDLLCVPSTKSTAVIEGSIVEESLSRKGLFGQSIGDPKQRLHPAVDNPDSFMRAGSVRYLQTAFKAVHSILCALGSSKGYELDEEARACEEYAIWCFEELVCAWQVYLNALGRSIVHHAILKSDSAAQIPSQSQLFSALSQVYCTQYDGKKAYVLNVGDDPVAVDMVRKVSSAYWELYHTVFVYNCDSRHYLEGRTIRSNVANSIDDHTRTGKAFCATPRALYTEAYWWFLHRLSFFGEELPLGVSSCLLEYEQCLSASLGQELDSSSALETLWLALTGVLMHYRGTIDEEESILGHIQSRNAEDIDGYIGCIDADARLLSRAISFSMKSIVEASDSFLNLLVKWLESILMHDGGIDNVDKMTKVSKFINHDNVIVIKEAKETWRKHRSQAAHRVLNACLGTIWRGIFSAISSLDRTTDQYQVKSIAEGLRRLFATLLCFNAHGMMYPVSPWLGDSLEGVDVNQCLKGNWQEYLNDLRDMLDLWVSYEDMYAQQNKEAQIITLDAFCLLQAHRNACSLSFSLSNKGMVEAQLGSLLLMTHFADAINANYTFDAAWGIKIYLKTQFLRLFIDWTRALQWSILGDTGSHAGNGTLSSANERWEYSPEDGTFFMADLLIHMLRATTPSPTTSASSRANLVDTWTAIVTLPCRSRSTNDADAVNPSPEPQDYWEVEFVRIGGQTGAMRAAGDYANAAAEESSMADLNATSSLSHSEIVPHGSFGVSPIKSPGSSTNGEAPSAETVVKGSSSALQTSDSVMRGSPLEVMVEYFVKALIEVIRFQKEPEHCKPLHECVGDSCRATLAHNNRKDVLIKYANSLIFEIQRNPLLASWKIKSEKALLALKSEVLSSFSDRGESLPKGTPAVATTPEMSRKQEKRTWMRSRSSSGGLSPSAGLSSDDVSDANKQSSGCSSEDVDNTDGIAKRARRPFDGSADQAQGDEMKRDSNEDEGLLIGSQGTEY